MMNHWWKLLIRNVSVLSVPYDLLVIGVKNKIIKRQNEQRLPGDIFDWRIYYLFRHQARYL